MRTLGGLLLLVVGIWLGVLSWCEAGAAGGVPEGKGQSEFGKSKSLPSLLNNKPLERVRSDGRLRPHEGESAWPQGGIPRRRRKFEHS